SNVDLGASYVAIGHRFVAGPVEGAFVAGSGVLAAHANLIDLRGQLRIEGAEQIDLASAGDIRLIGVLPNDAARELAGGLWTDAQFTFRADQIYATALTNFRIDQRRDAGTVTIVGNDAPTPVLSAGGSLAIFADNIVQAGVLKAPGGQILLHAADHLTL